MATDTAGKGAPLRAWARRHVWAIIASVVGVVVIAVALHHFAGSHQFSLVDSDLGNWAYLLIFLLVFGDGVTMILPGETTLNAGAALATTGQLELGLVMLSGALGAVAGDVTVYVIARKYRDRVRPQYERASQNPKVAAALAFMGSRAPILIVAGRYVPGLRWVVSATMGLQEYPFSRFLLWDAIGGTLWSVYTCALAYAVATALSQFPLASIIISGLVTSTAIAVLFIVVRRNRPAIEAVQEPAT